MFELGDIVSTVSVKKKEEKQEDWTEEKKRGL
jgi:hypothetical protein